MPAALACAAALSAGFLAIRLASYGVPTLSALCLSCLIVGGGGIVLERFLREAMPPVWRPVSDFEMVQLLEMARFYARVGSLVHQVNEQGRDFVYQDWLQARAIEIEVGKELLARDAQRMLQAEPAARLQA